MKMEEIARLSGVSRQTVSAVLNGKTWVSEKTREKVMKVVQDHHYSPNQHAVSLGGRTSNLIGVVLRDISNAFYTQVAMGIEAIARKRNYSLLYYNTFESHEAEVEAIHALQSYNVAGAIISPVIVGVELSHLSDFRRRGKELVSIDQIPGVKAHSISFENENSAYEAVKYLIEKGHRRIAYLAGPDSSISNQARLLGYKSSLVDHGVPVDRSLIISAGTSAEERDAAAGKLFSFSESTRPTAVFCFNDLIAISVYKVAHERNIHIPREISVVGIDDIDMAGLLGPPLTTIRLHAMEAGAEAARIIISAIDDRENYPLQKKVFKPELIERQSVRDLNK